MCYLHFKIRNILPIKSAKIAEFGTFHIKLGISLTMSLCQPVTDGETILKVFTISKSVRLNRYEM